MKKRIKTGVVYKALEDNLEYSYYYFDNTGYYCSKKLCQSPWTTTKVMLTEQDTISALIAYAQKGGKNGFKAVEVLRSRFTGFENYKPELS